MVKGLNRGSVDALGVFSYDEPEAWQAWADGMVERHPEATLCQLFRMTESGEFGTDEDEECE